MNTDKTKEVIIIGSDHGGVILKEKIILALKTTHPELEIIDVGTHGTESVDYPDIAELLCQKLLDQQIPRGILICGSGIGISIAANRHNGIRAALVYSEETARLSRAHNNANVICLGERTLDQNLSLSCVEIWLNTAFEGGRHERRVQKLC